MRYFAPRLVTCLRQWVPKLKEGGFTELVFEDALEMLIDQLNSLGQDDSLTIASLEENFRDDMVSKPGLSHTKAQAMPDRSCSP